VEPYVTPERFKTMGFGVDLDTIDDFELRAILRRASDRVNALAAAPALPVPHDFRGGSIVQEEHFWRMGNAVNEPSQRQFWLWHYPILDVSQLRIHLTNNQYIDFSTNELVVTDRWVEVVSLAMTANGLFGAFIVPEIGLAKPVYRVNYTYGHSIPVIKQTLDATDGRTFRAQDQWWDDTATTTVYDEDDSEITSGFTLDHVEGAVIFDDNQDPDVTRKASFTTTLPQGIATATGILAAESIGDREMRARGMSGLRSISVGEIALEKDHQMRGGQTLVTPAQAEAESILAAHKFIWAGA